MMDISSFLATIAGNFKNKYLSLAQEFNHLMPQVADRPIEPLTPTEPTEKPTVPVDEYQPSGDPAPVTPGASEATTDTDQPATPTTDNPVEQKPDGTYYYQRQARLDYKLDLRFDLGAIMQTVERLSDGPWRDCPMARPKRSSSLLPPDLACAPVLTSKAFSEYRPIWPMLTGLPAGIS